MTSPLPINQRLIISLYDYTTAWVQPYIKAGYPVIVWDKKVEGDILERFSWLCGMIDDAIEEGYIPYGILSATPCDDFAGSGARWWAEKDKPVPGYEPFENSVEMYTALALVVFMLRDRYETLKFWVVENPVGRIEKLVPELVPFRKMLFNPCDYGDAYTKKTVLWGEFNTSLQKNEVEPQHIIWAGKKFPMIYAGTGGRSEKAKAKRSATPAGFANAFFQANQ